VRKAASALYFNRNSNETNDRTGNLQLMIYVFLNKKDMKLFKFPLSLLLIVCSSLLLTSCSKDNNSDTGTNNTPTTPGATSNNVSINNMQFSVGSLTVKAGTTVTWTNNETIVHTVTADNGSFTSGDIKYGETYSRTFSTAGTFNYHCTYHPSMKAAVVVN
jgi:amicyanin